MSFAYHLFVFAKLKEAIRGITKSFPKALKSTLSVLLTAGAREFSRLADLNVYKRASIKRSCASGDCGNTVAIGCHYIVTVPYIKFYLLW